MHRESTAAVLGAAVVALVLPTLLLSLNAVVMMQVGAALAFTIPWWMRLPVGSVLAMESTTHVLMRSSGTGISAGRAPLVVWVAALPIGAGLALAGTALASFTIIALPFSQEYLTMREAQFAPILQMTSTLVGSIVVFLTVAVVPGVFEERTFRGALLTHCQGWSTASRALLSGAVFALVHLDPVSLLALLLVGTTLTVVADRTRGWAVPAVAHATLNAFNTLVWPRWFGMAEPTATQALLILLAGLVLVASGVRLVTLLSDAR